MVAVVMMTIGLVICVVRDEKDAANARMTIVPKSTSRLTPEATMPILPRTLKLEIVSDDQSRRDILHDL